MRAVSAVPAHTRDWTVATHCLGRAPGSRTLGDWKRLGGSGHATSGSDHHQLGLQGAVQRSDGQPHLMGRRGRRELVQAAAGEQSLVLAALQLADTHTSQSNKLFHNYLNETRTFGDSASAALLTSVSYRLAQLELSTSTIQQAESTRAAIYTHISASTGVLSPVVDPLSYGNQGRTTSPEGQAFVLLMEAAWRDWKEMSDKPGNGGGVNLSNDTVSFGMRDVVDWRVGSAALVAAAILW